MTGPRPYALLAEITVPMSAALPVLLKPCSRFAVAKRPAAAQGSAATKITASSRRKNGNGSFVKPPRLVFCKSVFPEANRLPGAISPN